MHTLHQWLRLAAAWERHRVLRLRRPLSVALWGMSALRGRPFCRKPSVGPSPRCLYVKGVQGQRSPPLVLRWDARVALLPCAWSLRRRLLGEKPG